MFAALAADRSTVHRIILHRLTRIHFRIMADICRSGLLIEQALGGAQDVEGVVEPDGRVTVVQTRPQM